METDENEWRLEQALGRSLAWAPVLRLQRDRWPDRLEKRVTSSSQCRAHSGVARTSALRSQAQMSNSLAYKDDANEDPNEVSRSHTSL